MDRLKTIGANILVIAVIAVVLIWGVTRYRQWDQYSRGERAEAAGDAVAAIADYEAALHMYTPGSPLVERAAARLWAIGEIHERQGDRERALLAYRALRSSFYAVRWLVQPGREWIARCDDRIPRLVQTARPGN
jgi:hypothetical protein